jgi:hypothetical protein
VISTQKVIVQGAIDRGPDIGNVISNRDSSIANYFPYTIVINHLIKRVLFTKKICNHYQYFDTRSMETDTSSTTADSIDAVGFWVSFTLIVGLSACEALASIFWTRIRVTFVDEQHWFSIHVCGHEVVCRAISIETAQTIADLVAEGKSICGYNSHSIVRNRETVIDVYGSISFVPTFAIRRFNPTTSLAGASELVKSFTELFWGFGEFHCLANFVHLFVELVDISLGITGLVLIPNSLPKLWDTLQDVTAPMTLENYLTLLMIWWILGVLLLVAMLPLHSKHRFMQLFGLPGLVASVVANSASFVLFGLGCWKIDYARRNGLDWTPLLSYWIGGASSISCTCCEIEVFHTFGFVGLVFMLLHTF